MMLQHEYFINFLHIKTYVNPKSFFLWIAMNDVHIEQPYDMLYIDLFIIIYQKSNNENITSPKDTDLTLFREDK